LFKSRCKVVVCTLVVMLFVSTGVFASRVELGANVMKGSLRISDHWLYGRINNDMSFLSFAGKVALTTNLELEVEHMFGKAELAEPDDYGINFYGYTNTKLGGKLKLSDSVSILIGYSRVFVNIKVIHGGCGQFLGLSHFLMPLSQYYVYR
jgi:hypothetical protein